MTMRWCWWYCVYHSLFCRTELDFVRLQMFILNISH